MRRLSWAALATLATALPCAAADSDSSTSLYRLEAPLVNQDARAVKLDVHRGHPVVVTMFYSSCQATCPLIIDTLRAVERGLDAQQRSNVRVLLISIDPQRDTPQELAEQARIRHLDTSRWTLAQTDVGNVRKIAAALGIQYRQLPSGEFSHSTIISVLNAGGEITAQSAELGHADPKLLTALR